MMICRHFFGPTSHISVPGTRFSESWTTAFSNWIWAVYLVRPFDSVSTVTSLFSLNEHVLESWTLACCAVVTGAVLYGRPPSLQPRHCHRFLLKRTGKSNATREISAFFVFYSTHEKNTQLFSQKESDVRQTKKILSLFSVHKQPSRFWAGTLELVVAFLLATHLWSKHADMLKNEQNLLVWKTRQKLVEN